MNKIYRIVWSASSSAWVVASEFAKGDVRGGVASRSPLRRRALACGVALFLAGAPPAFAQSYWDGTDTNANANGGNGTWSTGATNWDTAAIGGANVAWANGMDAVFGGSGTVTLGAGGVTANSLKFDGTSYTFNATAGNKLTLSGSATIDSSISGQTQHFNVDIIGSNGLTKTGSGTIQLNNANTYSGVTRLQAGGLSLNNVSALGANSTDASDFVLSANTTLNLFNAAYTRPMTFSGGTVTFGGNSASWSGTPTLAADTTLLLAGTLTLSGGLADTGTFKLSLTNSTNNTLTGTNTYTGQTRLTGGTLTIGTASLPTNSNLAFDAANDAFITVPVNFSRTLGTGDTQMQWIRSGGFMSTTGLVKTIDLGTDLVWGSTPGFLATTATLDLAATSGFLDFRNNLALPLAGTTYTTHIVGTLASHPILSGVVSGPGNLLVTGGIPGFNTSLLELSGANTFSGQLILAGLVNEGNVLISGATSLPTTANLRFNGSANATGSNLVLGTNAGDFTDALGTGANQVQWTGNGGFSAAGAPRFVDIGNGATLTWNTAGFVPTNSWLTLATAGDKEIDFRNDIDLNGAVRTILFGTVGSPRLTGDLSNGGVVYRGGGAGSVEGASTYTGTTTIGSGSGTTTVNVTAIGNGGTSGNLGAATNAASNILLNGGTINYRGAGETTNRNLTVQTAGGSLSDNNATGALVWNGVTGQSGATVFTLGGSPSTSFVNRVDGLVVNGGATLGVDKTGSGNWQLANAANTYTGATRVFGGVLEVTTLVNGGIASSIGASTNAAANLVGGGGTLRYVGATNVATDRNVQLANNFTIESSGAGVVNWSPTTGLDIVATTPTLTLGGTNTGANVFSAPMLNHVNANNVNQASSGLTKSGVGTWHIGGSTDATYTGNTTLVDGLLIADTAKSITGGFNFDSNTTANTGYTGLAAPSSLIMFTATGADGGVLGLTTANNGPNGFRRVLSTAGQSFNSNSTPITTDDTFVHGVRWLPAASGGFAAMDGTQVVNIGATGALMTWGSNGFVAGRFLLGATSAAGTVDFQNQIAFANAARTFDVRDGSASVDAILSGLITGGGSGASFNKIGAGTLALTANNTNTGGLSIQAGTLQVGNGGATGSIGNNANVFAGATLAFDRNNAITYGNLLSGAGTLRQQGTGTTTLTNANTIGATQVTGGTLVASNALTTSSLSLGAGTMRVSGTMQGSGASRVAVSGVAGTAGTLQVDSGGTLRANGTLGDGNDTLRVAGLLDTTGGLTLGAGDDAFDIVDGSNSGDVDGGADNDTATATLAVDAQIGALLNFETLNKSGLATLDVMGPTASSIANVNLNAGRLRVHNGASVNGPATGAQTTTIANGARLSVDAGGTYGCGIGDDTLSIAGLVDGAGSVSQCGGNDTLTLRDGASLSLGGAIDGGAQTTFDRVLVDVAGALTFDGARVTNYEQLTKQGAGTLTLAGNHAYSSGVSQLAGSEVIVAGALDVSRYTMTGAGTLTVTGSATNSVGGLILFDGDASQQRFDVRAGGTLMARGTLGDGSDTITLAGTLDTGLGYLALGDGNDRVDVLDGGAMRGEIDGDTGTDQLVANIGTSASIGSLEAFESLRKSGAGTLTFDGGATNTVDAITVDGGRLDITLGTGVVAQGSTMTVDVGTGATLDVAGLLGCNTGTDTWTIAGTVSGGGDKVQCDGDDTLILRDGASITGTAIDGGAALTGDTVVIDNVASMTTGGFTNYETLRKQNTGGATLAGDHTLANGIDLLGGELTLSNATRTDQVDMAGGTMLQVDGDLRGNAGVATNIDGDAGAQTVVFAGTGTVHADFGDGADLFEVMADVRTDGGAVLLGAGDDRFVLHEGANLFGTIDAGAGLDTFDQNVTTTATIGTALGFEALAKSGVGTLVFDGTAASDFQRVTVSEGLLRVASGASFITPTTVVEATGTLRVDGSYGCGTGNDTLDIAGTFEVNGTVDQCGGDDTFTLHDGATLLGTGLVNGGAQTLADTFVLDIAGSRTIGADEVTGYEVLSKRNIGDVTLVGSQAYDTRVEIQGGVLSVAGTLSTAEVDMDANTLFAVFGRAQGLAGSATTLSGSTGIETVFVDAGATLVADGDLGDGNDILDLAGTLDTNGGTLSLGAGDDEVRIYDTSDLADADVDAGAGNDLLDIHLGTGVTFQLGSTAGFESLGKSGAGTMEIDGANAFLTVRANDGVLHVASTGTLDATTLDLATAATLRIDGALRGTSGGDTFTLAGALTGGGTVDLGAGNDTLVFNDGADSAGFAQTLHGGIGTDTLDVDIAGNATLAATDGFETLQKRGVGALSIAGDNVFDSIALDAGTLRVQSGADVTGSGAAFNATLAVGTTLDLAGTFGCNTGNDAITLDGAVTGAGAVQQCAGDDVLRVRDGVDFTGFTGAIDGGANNDTVQLDTASAMQFGGNVVNYETLQKVGAGVATVTGNASYATRTAVDAGTLQIAGALETAQIALADGTTLRIDGSASGLAATQASLVGSAGANTLVVGTNALLRASGSLGDGDDTLTLQDGASIEGAIDGGAGLDTFNTDIATTARFGAATGFEALDKTGAGVLEVAGTAVSDFARVTVSAGTLDVQAGGAISGAQTTTVAANAIFNVAGAFDATAGMDVLDIAGAVTGASTLFLGDGDDVLRLRDGASLAALVDGGLPTASDAIVLDAANALAFDATRAINFESLQKLGAGSATLTGTATYTNVALDAGELAITGAVVANAFALSDDTTLRIDGTATGAMNGTSGVNTIVIGAGATLAGAGDLGAGDDVLNVMGRLDTTAGAFALGDGDDRLIVHDTTQIVGAGGLDAGAGNDRLDVDVGAGTVVPVPALAGFESLGKSGLGTLELNGAASFIDVAVMDGLLHVAGGGTVIAHTLQVDGSAHLQLDGGFAGTAGDDSVSIAGRVSGAGAFALGDGNDTLTLNDGADLSTFASTLDGGTGIDTLSAEIATQASLAPSIAFENLSKTGLGVLSVRGAQSFDHTYVGEGTLDVAAGATLASRSTLVLAGATLDVAGAFTGTAGDDDFESTGVVRGALAFGAGNDRVLVGGGAFDATQVDGGDGNDALTFRGQAVGDNHVAALRNFERMSLEASTLGLSTTVKGVDVLELDAASTLTARAGASLAGSLVNGGTIRVDDARLSIGRDYSAGPSSILHVLVSPGRNTAGGLAIAGNVTGTTSVVFDSDGSTGGSTDAILVIDSANDVRGDGGAFTSDAIVRLGGSPYAWGFAQADDNRWYLGTDAETVVPEVNGYAALPAMALDTLRGTRLATFGHLDAIRGNSDCDREQARDGQIERRDCSGAWMSAGGIETRIGEGGGLAYSGDSHGLHVGVDGTVHEDDAREVRVGGFAGQVEGNYWTRDDVNVRLEGPVFGAYGELRDARGGYFSVALMHQRNDATVQTFDGFKQALEGDALALVQQAGWQLDVGNGWSLEPQAQVGITRARWNDVTDASGKPLAFVDDTTGELRAALRVERTFLNNGGLWRPWFTVALEDTVGESKAALSVQQLAMPGEMLGQRWTFDAGIEAHLHNGLSVFGAVGVRRELNGPTQDSQQARIGLRWAW